MTEERKDELKVCPLCGSDVELSADVSKPTLEEALTADPRAKCSRPTCAMRYVVCNLSEWNTRATPDLEALRAEIEGCLPEGWMTPFVSVYISLLNGPKEYTYKCSTQQDPYNGIDVIASTPQELLQQIKDAVKGGE